MLIKNTHMDGLQEQAALALIEYVSPGLSPEDKRLLIPWLVLQILKFAKDQEIAPHNKVEGNNTLEEKQ